LSDGRESRKTFQDIERYTPGSKEEVKSNDMMDAKTDEIFFCEFANNLWKIAPTR
jgi:hypothetical protein